MQRYLYKGPVMEFGRCISNCWEGSTIAPSESKARSNLAYQFKKNNNKIASTKISLPGEIVVVG